MLTVSQRSPHLYSVTICLFSRRVLRLTPSDFRTRSGSVPPGLRLAGAPCYIYRLLRFPAPPGWGLNFDFHTRLQFPRAPFLLRLRLYFAWFWFFSASRVCLDRAFALVAFWLCVRAESCRLGSQAAPPPILCRN